MGKTVKIDAAVWDLICEHYAGLSAPSESDKVVIRYIVDKMRRQMEHDDYLSSKARYARLEETKTSGS